MTSVLEPTADSPSVFVLKLKNGETLFAEVATVEETFIMIRKPMKVIDLEGSIMCQPWMPYIDDSSVMIPTDQIFLFEPLNNKYVKLYGSILMQQEMLKIKSETLEIMDGSPGDRYLMKEAVSRIDAASEYMTAKYGIERIDTSQFSEKVNEKILMH